MLIMIVSLLVTSYLYQHEKRISDAWKLLLATGAGTGGVYLFRWYWWRINAWSEVSAMVVAAALSLFLQLYWFTAPTDPAMSQQQLAYYRATTVRVRHADDRGCHHGCMATGHLPDAARAAGEARRLL